MGRYYKTANPQTLDFMYKLPEQYMFAAVQQASKDITENQAAMYDLYGKLQLNALSKDKERAKQILGGYEDSINEIAAELQADPLSFRRKGGDLLGLSRKMTKDFTRGEAAAIQSNYNIDAEWQKAYDKAARTGKLENANWIQGLRARNLEKYQGVGYNDSTGNYNQYNPENLATFVNIDDVLAKKAAEIEKQVRAEANAKVEMVPGADGKMIRETAETREKRTQAKIIEVTSEYFRNDPTIQAYIKQGSDIGMLSGYYTKDAEGNLDKQISPFILGDDGQYKLNPESAAAQKFGSMVTRFAVDNVTSKKNVLKNITGDGSGSNAMKSNMLPATIDGNQVVNPVAYLGGSTTPVKDAEALALSYKNEAADKRILSDGFRGLLTAVDNGYYTDKESLDQIKQLGTLIQKHDLAGLENLVAKSTLPLVADLRNALGQVRENHIQADNIMAQTQAYKNLAVAINEKKKKNGDKGPDIKAEDLMTGKIVFPQLVNESTGDFYNLRPDDVKKFNSILLKINDKWDDSYKLAANKVVWEQDSSGKSTIRRITNEEYMKMVKPTELDKRGGKKDDSTTTGGGAMNGSLSDEMSSSRGLNPTGKVGNDIQMVTGEISYEYTDDKGVKRVGTLKQPFTKKVDTYDGKKITLVLPRNMVNLPELEAFDHDQLYQAKTDFEIRTERANNMVLGIEHYAKEYGVDVTIPEFKFNDATTFVPNVTGGLGVYKIKGIPDAFPESQHNYMEYLKTMK